MAVAIGDGVSALATLGVVFGGFSPTAMDGVDASREYVEKMEEIQAQKKAAAKRRRDLEIARTSKQMTYIDEDGTKWTYVVVDGRLARIVGCNSTISKLEIPSSIDGHDVYAIGPDACSRNDYTREIICPDTVEFIGSCAFRFCPNLTSVVFPKNVLEFSSSWLSHCPSLRRVVLPAGLDSIGLSVFDNAHIEELEIGPNVQEIEPGAFQKTCLKKLSIDESNPFIRTDGDAIYTIDGTRLLAVARPVRSYAVLPGCRVIGRKAANNLTSLEHVTVPEGVSLIEDFAFAHAGLTSFTAPSTLTALGEKAFYYCKDLMDIKLNEGLVTVGNSAFEESGLTELHLPASIDEIGNSITAKTNIVHAGPGCTLTIDSASKSLFLDGEGGLYRYRDDGIHMVQLVDSEAISYRSYAGATFIDEYAFAFHGNIQEVEVAEGTEIVGRNAFRCAGRLRRVTLPASVVEIGDEAFLDTELEELRIPKGLVRIGANALVTKGAHHGDEVPSLRTISVEEGNPAFFMHDGMLCKREGKFSRIIMFTSSAPRVVFPEDVESVEAYAFNNARGIEYIHVNKNLKAIGTSGLATWCWIKLIHVEIPEPIEGRTQFEFSFPNTRKGIHGISMGLGGASWVNVPGIMAQYDNCVVNAHDYNSPRNPDSIPVYDQTTMIVGRLKDPILLTKVNRSMYDRLLRNYIVEICVDVARHDDRVIMDDLLNMGYLNADNLETVIAAVGKLQDAAMTGYLLEVKRRRFNQAIFDFDL